MRATAQKSKSGTRPHIPFAWAAFALFALLTQRTLSPCALFELPSHEHSGSHSHVAGHHSAPQHHGDHHEHTAGHDALHDTHHETHHAHSANSTSAAGEVPEPEHDDDDCCASVDEHAVVAAPRVALTRSANVQPTQFGAVAVLTNRPDVIPRAGTPCGRDGPSRALPCSQYLPSSLLGRSPPLAA